MLSSDERRSISQTSGAASCSGVRVGHAVEVFAQCAVARQARADEILKGEAQGRDASVDDCPPRVWASSAGAGSILNPSAWIGHGS